MFVAGIDIGSLWAKVVILENERDEIKIHVQGVKPTSMRAQESAEVVLEEALKNGSLSRADIEKTVATGYGRITVPWATKTITEITCHAKGINWLLPSVRTLIDIGGQDTKTISVDDDGNVRNFLMNDKCAAGTGRFIEVMAGAVGIDLEEIGQLALQAAEKVHISSLCTVFAESEAVSLVSQGVPVSDIIAGIFESISDRVCNMLSRMRCEEEYALSGGTALNIGIVKALKDKIGCKLLIPDEPRTVGALGAALIALSL
ncbi:MAG: acyl-CoA dehydratase activase [Chloroflexota bacterium]|nr:acyl-CoA dehydratase activase [Chloroflexota bacterium]